jgi:hypothetical protein
LSPLKMTFYYDNDNDIKTFMLLLLLTASIVAGSGKSNDKVQTTAFQGHRTLAEFEYTPKIYISCELSLGLDSIPPCRHKHQLNRSMAGEFS